MTVKFAEMRPKEFRERLAEQPIAYLPMGTLEWHGEHMPLGADAYQAEAVMVACAERYGGIVMPPIYFGPDNIEIQENSDVLIGMELHESTVPSRKLDGNCYWVSNPVFKRMMAEFMWQLHRIHFTAVFADGHGPSRLALAELMKEHDNEVYGVRLFGITREVRRQWKTQVDHAGRKETSLMLHIRPDLVDMMALPRDLNEWPQGVSGQDPRDANADYGRICLDASVEVVGKLFSDAGLIEGKIQ